MRVLNLYAGLGGNRKLWRNVEVVAVEQNQEIADIYQDLFPQDTVIVSDAHEYLLNSYQDFDFIWSSPPCQSHSRMVKATRHNIRKYPDLRLYEEIIFLQEFFGGRWVVENVKPYYKPLIAPSAVLGRHVFWSNFYIPEFDVPTPKGFIVNSTLAGADTLKKWLGLDFDGYIYYEGNHCPAQVLRNCVHPEMGVHVFGRAISGKTKVSDNIDGLYDQQMLFEY